MYFREWKCLKFDEDFTELKCLIWPANLASVVSDNDFTPNRRQVVIWISDGKVYWRKSIRNINSKMPGISHISIDEKMTLLCQHFCARLADRCLQMSHANCGKNVSFSLAPSWHGNTIRIAGLLWGNSSFSGRFPSQTHESWSHI